MLLSSDTANATTKSVGLATIGFTDAYEDLQPDLLLILGDRYEILAAVTAALFYKIPVAHLHGGEITEGAYDDAIRHAISKMSHLHFTSTEQYRNRVIQLGENPDRVFNVGAIGIDNIKHLDLLSKTDLEADLKFEIKGACILVTFHPVTLENNTSEEQTGALLEVIEEMNELRIIFTMPNSDSNGRIIMKMIEQFVARNYNRSIVFTSLGYHRYLSALQYIDAVVGNSSSGIIEAPSFNVPTLNIGNRQGGRIKSLSVVDCDPAFEDIKKNLIHVLSKDFKKSCQNFTNPYEKKETALEIYSVIKNYKLDRIINKEFYNL
jgi:UDP-hydrolysing UDP-N-acetyl-D-glucosamine 2-epimerase